MVPYPEAPDLATVARIATAALLIGVLGAAHWLADYGVQTDAQAQRKGVPGWPGRVACAAHVATYTLTTALAVGLVWWLLDLPITLGGFLTGQAFSAATHYLLDRRVPLERLADFLGKGAFYRSGEGLARGSHYLDQAGHRVCLLAAALITVAF